uniref:Uncharacterized protein n=1 Tax=Plectus sambesii TaxID=2011161 RepID=A0A914V7H2_9BILA
MPFVDQLASWSKDEFGQSHYEHISPYTRVSLPSERSKLAVCLNGQNLHIFGGRLKNGEIVRDLWQYNIETQVWYRHETSELPRLEGHAIACTEKGDVYFFGGTFSRIGCPLWLWTQDSPAMRVAVDPSMPAPGSRRGHSLTYINNCLYLYGGYIDMHGSTDSLWQFHCDSQQWSLLSIDDGPNGRHGHSAVAFNGCLYVYGGLSDLRAKGDFWKFDIAAQKWEVLRAIVHPTARFGHSCCVTRTRMFLFGGEDGNGNRKDDLWCYDFLKKDWSRVMCDPECKPSAAVYSSLIALEPAYIAGNSRMFSLKKTPEYLANRKLEAEAGECSVCKYPIVEEAPMKQERLITNISGTVERNTYPSGHHRSPGSEDSGFQEQYIRSASEFGLVNNFFRRDSNDTQPYMINMGFERGSTDVDDELFIRGRLSQISHTFDGRMSQVELALPSPTEELEDEELPGAVPEMRTARSTASRSSFLSHRTQQSARSSTRSHISPTETSRHLTSSHSEFLMPPATPIPRSPKSRSSISPERMSLTHYPSPFQDEPWFHSMPASALNNNSLSRSLNVLPHGPPSAAEEIEMAQMTHFMRNGFVSTQDNYNGMRTTNLNADTHEDGALDRGETGKSRQHVENFCVHSDGRCTQLMLIGGKYNDARTIGGQVRPESLSVWRCCVRQL